MPAISLERVPLPSLQTYTSISVILLACCLFYAHQTVTNEDAILGVANNANFKMIWSEMENKDIPTPQEDLAAFLKEDVNLTEPIEPPEQDSSGNTNSENTRVPLDGPDSTLEFPEENLNITLPYDDYMWNMIFVLTTEIWCVWTLVNTAYCILILLAKGIQKVIFGELRVSEQQHLKDKFWNFVFYKFIFIFGVMNVQTMEEVVLWVAWFSSLGFFHLMTQLSKDRFEYLSFSPTTSRSSHIKLLLLLSVVLISCGGLMAVCIYTGFNAGLTIFSFMAAECILLSIRTLYVLVRYFIHLYDMNMEGVWENRSTYVYFTELVFELAALSVDFSHHLHMLLWGNIFLSMASLVICMQLRYLFYEFQRRIKRHKNYLRVVKNMDAKFPMATVEELEKNADNCAICWEKMDAARKLPCGHLFHNACLRSSLEQDTACPTCRMSLGDDQPHGRDGAIPLPNPNPNNDNQAQNQANNQALVNHFFHFDGSRYVSWLPSFSVEVTHTSLLPGQQQPHIQTSQLDNMARQVQNVFPTMPLPTITDDLRITRSVDLTIDNILEGRLVAPPTTSLSLRTDASEVQVLDSIPIMSEPLTTTTTTLQSSHTPTTSNIQQPEDLLNFLTIDSMENEFIDDDDDDDDLIDESYLPSSSTSAANDKSLVDDDTSLHTSGGRFSKSSQERMDMLNIRKNNMLAHARRRYLSKTNDTADSSDSTIIPPQTETGFDTASDNTQRHQILQATQRRLHQDIPYHDHSS